MVSDRKADRNPAPSPNQREAEQEGEKNRRELDEVPEHGSDPLHEGP
jgi:hypothetical protein